MKTNDLDRGRSLWAFAAIACVAIAAFAVLATTFSRGGAEPPRSTGSEKLAWHAGDQQSYRVRVQSRMRLGVSSAAVPQDVQQVIAGTLHLRVFDVRGDQVTLGLQLQPIELSVNGQVDAARGLELGTAFGAVFSSDGRPESFRFPSALGDIARMQLEEIVRGFQFVVPADAGAEWRTTEEHASGRYTAAYERGDARELSKTKLGYLAGAEMRNGAELMGRATTRVNGSAGTAVLVGSGSWLESASIREELVVISGTEGTFRASIEAELERQEDRGDATALRAVADLSRLIADQQTEYQQRVYRAPEPSSADIARLWEMIEELNRSGGADVGLLRDLADELRRFPKLAALVPEILEDPTLADRTASGLVHVLELAAHEIAQSSLAVVAADAERSHMNRIRAVIASGGVDAPAPATLEQLWELSADRSSDDAADLANTALLSLGRLGSTLRDSESPEYDELRARIAHSLASSFDADTTSAALAAIGNTADPSLAADAERYLGSASALVRASAAETIAALHGPRALETLTASLQREADGGVRTAIVESLGKLEQKSPATFAAVHSRIQNETDPGSRFALARYLADHLDAYPDARPTLEKLMETETEARTVQYLAGKLYR